MKRKLRRAIALAALSVSLWVLISGCYAESQTSSGTTGTTGTTGQATGTAQPPATPMKTDTTAAPAAPDTSGGKH